MTAASEGDNGRSENRPHQAVARTWDPARPPVVPTPWTEPGPGTGHKLSNVPPFDYSASATSHAADQFKQSSDVAERSRTAKGSRSRRWRPLATRATTLCGLLLLLAVALTNIAMGTHGSGSVAKEGMAGNDIWPVTTQASRAPSASPSASGTPGLLDTHAPLPWITGAPTITAPFTKPLPVVKLPRLSKPVHRTPPTHRIPPKLRGLPAARPAAPHPARPAPRPAKPAPPPAKPAPRPATPPAPKPAAPPANQMWYYATAANVAAFVRPFYANPWRCLDDHNWGTANETHADLWMCQWQSGSPVTKQQWHFTRQGDGSYTILNVYSRLCLDGHDFVNHPQDGAMVLQHACNGLRYQRWWLRNARNYAGGFGGQLVNGYSNRCMTVPNYATNNGAPVTMTTCR
jgi:hypothetical protein